MNHEWEENETKESENKSAIVYSIADAEIAEMGARYLVLKISDPSDKEGLKKITEYRKEVKSKRVDIEKTRKSLKDKALKYGQRVDDEARRLTKLLEPIEAHLIEQEDIVKKEQERIKAAAQAKLQDEFDARVQEICSFSPAFNGREYIFGEGRLVHKELWEMPLEKYNSILEKVKDWKGAQDKRLALEEESRKAEAEKQKKIADEQAKKQEALDKIAEEQAEQSRKLKEQQDAINESKRKMEEAERVQIAAENARIDAENKAKKAIIEANRAAEEAEKKSKEAVLMAIENEKRHKKELEDARILAEENAKKEAEKKLLADAEEKRKLAEAEELKAKQAPDKEKLLILASMLERINYPELSTEAFKDTLVKIKESVMKISKRIKEIAE